MRAIVAAGLCGFAPPVYERRKAGKRMPTSVITGQASAARTVRSIVR
jgi:hypothetical protein